MGSVVPERCDSASAEGEGSGVATTATASNASERDVAIRLQALANPARIRILRLLSKRDACCCKDVVAEIGMAQSTTSQHLKQLVEAGLVRYRPDRQTSRYSLDRAAIAGLATAIGGLLHECCRQCDEHEQN
jgi:ArsR family transcriptional regulator, arsenate/arsenite/antimonite-responsive transcriptional repressor